MAPVGVNWAAFTQALLPFAELVALSSLLGSLSTIFVPDLRHAWIGADHHAVLLASDTVILGRELDFALWRLCVVVKGLRVCVVNRCPTCAVQEGARPPKRGTLRSGRSVCTP